MKKSENNPDMKVLKTDTCKTLSGKSTLTYQVGCTPDNEIHLRITKNSGGGFFSDEWVKYDDIQEALKDDNEGAAITSIRLTSLFKGKSVNSPSFLLAALRDLKLVRPMKNKQRHHEHLDPGPFLEMIEKLIAPDVKTGGVTRKSPTKKAVKRKAAVKKRATTKRETSSS